MLGRKRKVASWASSFTIYRPLITNVSSGPHMMHTVAMRPEKAFACIALSARLARQVWIRQIRQLDSISSLSWTFHLVDV